MESNFYFNKKYFKLTIAFLKAIVYIKIDTKEEKKWGKDKRRKSKEKSNLKM